VLKGRYGADSAMTGGGPGCASSFPPGGLRRKGSSAKEDLRKDIGHEAELPKNEIERIAGNYLKYAGWFKEG
jgi:hypothetical protein